MRNFFAGLACAFAGCIVWLMVSAIFGVTEGIEAGLTEGESEVRPPPVFYWIAVPAFLLMICGPIWFWVIAPLWSWLKRHRT